MDYLEMLVKLGVGNAHPGGFAATLKQLEQYPIPAEANILEVGCGTGRTSCYLANMGYRVTGVDIRKEMVAKASIRAEKEHSSARFLQGDALSLPFPDHSFDVVLVESVSIFTDTARAVSEYARVLKDGGKLYDRELVQRAAMPVDVYDEIVRFYQIDKLADCTAWTSYLKSAGFGEAQIDGPFPFPELHTDLIEHPDPHQQIDGGSFLDAELWKVSSMYNRIMEQHGDYIGHILVSATK